MSHSTETKQSELSSTQQNMNQTDKPSYLKTNEPIENTPFRIVGNEETGYSITVGRHMLTEPKETKEKCLSELEEKKWIVMSNMTVAICQMIQEEQKKIGE